MSLHNLSALTWKPSFVSQVPGFLRAGSAAARRWGTTIVEDATRANRIAVLLFASAVFFAFSLAAFFFSLPAQSAAAEGRPAFASASMPAAAAAAGSSLWPLEIHIANNGLILLRSARVVSISGSTLTVSTAWGSSDFIWTVQTNATRFETRDFGTRFLNRDGKKSSLANIQEGDKVTITGALDPAAQEPVIKADSVRNLE